MVSSIADFLGSTAGSLTSFAVVVGGIYQIYRFAKRIDLAIGIDKDGRSLSDRTGRIEHQLWPNGGSSLADTVNNLQLDVSKSRAELKLVHDLLVTMVASSIKKD